MRRRPLLLLCLLTLAPVLARPAGGHALIQDATPGPAETVSGTVDRVVLEFTEPVLPTPEIQVRGPGADTVSADAAVVLRDEDLVAEVRFSPLREPGTYRVDYSYASIDGHVERGAYEFRFERSAATSAADTRTGQVVVGLAATVVLVALAAVAFRVRRRERAH